MTVRSVRNSNPGNIRLGMPWIGLASPSEMTPEQITENEFCVFKNAAYGFRALAMTLLTYYRKYKLKTVYSIISRFAPANENDTKAYVAAVAYSMNVQATRPIRIEDENTLTQLCRAIAVHEAGGWMFDVADLNAGVAMALGIEPTPNDDGGPIAA